MSLRGVQQRGSLSLFSYKIAALPLVARNDKYSLKDNSLYHVSLGQCLKLISKKI